MKAKLKYA